MTQKILKVLLLVALAIVVIPVGVVFSILETLLFTIKNIGRSIWSLIYGLFFSFSKVVSVCSGKFLTRLLTKRGVPFGTYSVSAVLGANLRERTLSKLGIWLVTTLDSIEENHCTRAAERVGI